MHSSIIVRISEFIDCHKPILIKSPLSAAFFTVYNDLIISSSILYSILEGKSEEHFELFY